GELDRVAVVERQHGLHRTLAEGAAADDTGTAVVAERTSQYLRGAGRTGVDQHNHRRAVQAVARGGAEGGVADRDAAARADDAAVLEQRVGDLHGRVEQPARVAAQVDHQSAQAATGLR